MELSAANSAGVVPRIRPATPTDIPEIRSIALITWPVAYGEILSAEQLRYMLVLMYSEDSLSRQMTEHRFLLALVDSAYVGFASFSGDERTQRSTRLHKLYVLPGQQGKGSGQALLAAVVTAAKEAGHLGLELNVNRHNKALAFYVRQGFKVVRDEKIDIGGGFFMDDHVLRMELSTA